LSLEGIYLKSDEKLIEEVYDPKVGIADPAKKLKEPFRKNRDFKLSFMLDGVSGNTQKILYSRSLC
jgi:hypothetical protein